MFDELERLVLMAVMNNLDGGPGSLRQAIIDANAAGGGTITFNLPANMLVISTAGLPTITAPVTIDATTQPGYMPGMPPVVTLDGGANQANGLTLGVGSNGSAVFGLFITDFYGDGVDVYSANDTIGGATTGGNVVSNNAGTGIVIAGTGATGNTVLGNFIGTDPTGTMALANGGDGIDIFAAATGNTIGGVVAGARNVISGNSYYSTSDGIDIFNPGTSGNLVQGNYIGVDVTLDGCPRQCRERDLHLWWRGGQHHRRYGRRRPQRHLGQRRRRHHDLQSPGAGRDGQPGPRELYRGR